MSQSRAAYLFDELVGFVYFCFGEVLFWFHLVQFFNLLALIQMFKEKNRGYEFEKSGTSQLEQFRFIRNVWNIECELLKKILSRLDQKRTSLNSSHINN